jgi:hypothetical protein
MTEESKPKLTTVEEVLQSRRKRKPLLLTGEFYHGSEKTVKVMMEKDVSLKEGHPNHILLKKGSEQVLGVEDCAGKMTTHFFFPATGDRQYQVQPDAFRILDPSW